MESNKTSTKGKRNFHISKVKLIWLIAKDVKSNFKALEAAIKLAE